MAILGQLDITTTGSPVQLCALSAAATVNVRLTNRTNNPINVSIAIVPSGTGSPGNQHWILYAFALDEITEEFGIPLSAGDQVFVQAAASGVSASCWGLVGA